MVKKYLPYGYQTVTKKDIDAVTGVLKSDFLTQGPKIAEFEDTLAKYVGAKFAVSFNSGTAALHAAYFALGLKKGDSFITSPMTFAATSNAGLYLGAKPIFVDCLRENGNIDPDLIEKKITKDTKLIIPIHYSGNPANLKSIYKIAKKNKLFVVEDACHGLGAKYYGKRIGNCQYSDMTVFSFHPVKNITTGEGGAVTTNSKAFYEKLLIFRSHGITKTNLKRKSPGDWYHEMHSLGYNYRITDLQSALGISQLKRLDNFLEKRWKIAKFYDQEFLDNPYFDFIKVEKDIKSGYHLYPILIKDKYKNRKAEIFAKLRRLGLGVQVHYIPTYLHPYYEDLGYQKGLCPNAEDFYEREISIPIFPTLSNKDQKYVVSTLFKTFEKL